MEAFGDIRAWPRPAAHTQALAAGRGCERRVPLVERTRLAGQRGCLRLVEAFGAGLAAFRVACRRGRGLVVLGLAGNARGRGAGADADVGPVDVHHVACVIAQHVAGAGEHGGAACRRPHAGGAGVARAVGLVRACRAGLATQFAGDFPRDCVVPGDTAHVSTKEKRQRD